ncbi:hypothetical protein [Halobaculum marinum]|uniref:Uncharacterized protein n=1 Tax=Halobaculum marinum TaxID=3031996 RepID=A0ABD5WR53_9EURY|nr:hypothetical protein [Halobaculum sp. DT55]
MDATRVGVVPNDTVDSAAPIGETGFTDDEVETLLRRYSTLTVEVLV